MIFLLKCMMSKERDGYKIIESGVSDIMREDRYSRKMGQLEEEADIERERRMKEKRRGCIVFMLLTVLLYACTSILTILCMK